MHKQTLRLLSIAMLSVALSGCWLAVAGAGAEAGYVASQEDRTTQETFNDQSIVARVKTKLIADPDVSALDINVDSFKGVVTLKGVVANELIRDKAIKIAGEVKGVKEVQSKLFIG